MSSLQSMGLVLTAGIALVGCGSGSDSVSAVTAETFALKAHAVTVSAVDAKTGAVISGTSTSFSFAGPSDLSNALGKAQTTASGVDNGAVTLYTDSTAAVTAAVTASGYLPGAASIYASRPQNVGAVKLVSLSAPPSGVTISTAGSATRADFDSTALAYVPGSARVAGSSAVALKFGSVAEITAAVSSLSLAASGDSAAVYYLAAGASDWTAMGKLPVSGGAVTVASAAAGTWAVATPVAAGPVTFSFAKSVGYDALVTLSASGWSRSFRSAGDSLVVVQGVPAGVAVTISSVFGGKQAYYTTHTFASGEAYSMDYAVTPAGTTQTFVARCTDGTTPSDLTPGFPLLVLSSGSELGAALVGPTSVSVSGLGSGTHQYLLPLLDKKWSFTPSSATIVVYVDCVNHVITGATGGSGD